jgi:hypothetical protein
MSNTASALLLASYHDLVFLSIDNHNTRFKPFSTIAGVSLNLLDEFPVSCVLIQYTGESFKACRHHRSVR